MAESAKMGDNVATRGREEPDERGGIQRKLYRSDGSACASIVSEFQSVWTDDDLRQYRDEGYVAMDGLLAEAEVTSAKQALTDILHKRVWDDSVELQEEPYYAGGGTDSRVDDDPELRIRKVWSFCQADVRMARLAAHPRVVPLLDQLIGAGHRKIADMALVKAPFHGVEKPWHQDTAYFDYRPLGGVIGVWIALDEATVENGCMQVMPGTHLRGPIPHYHVRDCQIPDRDIEVERAVVVPLKPGGALFFSGLLLHGTPPNTSGDRRRALQFHYAAAGCTRMTIREHGELFDDGGAYAGCREWDLEADMSRAVIDF